MAIKNYFLLYLIFAICSIYSCGQPTNSSDISRAKQNIVNPKKQTNYWNELADWGNLNTKQIAELKKISIEYEGYRRKQQKQLGRKLNDKELKLWRSKKFLSIERRMGKNLRDKVYTYNKLLTKKKK